MTVERFDIIDAFEKAMIDAGITPKFPAGKGVTDNGELFRFHVVGDSNGTRNGWGVLFGDGIPAGEFGSWKTGATFTWCARDRGTLTPEENAAIKSRIEAARAQRERERREREGDAAKLANLLWNDGEPVFGDDHPYLKRKGIVSHGLKRCAWPVRNTAGETFRHIDNTLLIPIYDAKGKITSLQGIFPSKDSAFGRDKDFLIGGKKQGCFYMVGKPPAAGGTVAFAEGYATAETIHQATGWCVVVCWDAYNLPHVAKVLREAMPQNVFVFAADNDQWTKSPVDNPGVTYARRAGAEVAGRLTWPQFTAEQLRQWREARDKGENEGPTDFNDLAELAGIDEVQAQLLPPVELPAPIPPPDTASGEVTGYVNPINPLSVDTATPFEDIDGKGKPLPTPTNLAEMLRRIRAHVRYNVISKDVDIIIPGTTNTIDNQTNASHAELLGWCARFRMSTANFDGNLVACADANPYNPVATWINSRPWDGTPRLQQLFDTVTAKSDTVLPNGATLKETLMRKWLLSAVAGAFSRDGVVARGVLTFQSEQNLGKTRWLKRLAPRELEVIADGLILNPSDKDSVKLCVSKWIVELGEVDATFRRSDMAALKAFISKDRDELRRPYARSESKFARRTVFFASVNPERFLRDETGNTRWWTINVAALNNDHDIDMQQVWAEVHSIYQREGEGCWHLTPEEVRALNEHNTASEEIDPVHDMIAKAFDWDQAPTLWTTPMRATDIAIAAGIDKPTKKDVNECASHVVKRYGVEKRKVGKAATLAWMMPSRVRTHNGPPL